MFMVTLTIKLRYNENVLISFLFLVLVDIGVEIKLSNKTFDKELENKSSPAYKELEDIVFVEVLGIIFLLLIISDRGIVSRSATYTKK